MNVGRRICQYHGAKPEQQSDNGAGASRSAQKVEESRGKGEADKRQIASFPNTFTGRSDILRCVVQIVVSQCRSDVLTLSPCPSLRTSLQFAPDIVSSTPDCCFSI